MRTGSPITANSSIQYILREKDSPLKMQPRCAAEFQSSGVTSYRNFFLPTLPTYLLRCVSAVIKFVRIYCSGERSLICSFKFPCPARGNSLQTANLIDTLKFSDLLVLDRKQELLYTE